jgi:hypothetical protein
MTNDDFLNVTMDPEPTKKLKYSLHKFFDKNGELVYVSKKPNFAIMMRNNWWWDIVRTEITHYDSLDEQEAAKCRAINNDGAKFNSHGRIP